MLVEPFIDGELHLITNANNLVSPFAPEQYISVLQAFAHFANYMSGGTAWPCDLQAFHPPAAGTIVCTDPRWVTLDGSLGWQDDGLSDIFKKVPEAHKCNAICKALKLPPLGKVVDRSRSTLGHLDHGTLPPGFGAGLPPPDVTVIPRLLEISSRALEDYLSNSKVGSGSV
mmetsp:Transcript_44337/g.79537  ORF Transcript_44337/g.79537 Transcript_44337/m.79537 type:complete len:171 (+) Transcript_44337:618-1130(+)